jgi:Activator of Hsp90 ATPase homolog 1-like protein
MEYGRKTAPESESGRVLLLAHQGNLALRKVYGDGESGSNAAYTWVSPNTLGQESMVTLTFKKQGEDTLLTLVHSDLPDHELARSHEKGWAYFLDLFPEQFGNNPRKKK